MSGNPALNNILFSLIQYRSAFVQKLREKGAQAASDASLYQALQAVEDIHSGGIQVEAGYIVNRDGELSFHSLQDSSSTSISALYTVDTPQEPQYQGSKDVP